MNVPLVAETLTTIGSWKITNTLVNSTILMVFFVVMSAVIGRAISLQPNRLQNLVEWIVESLLEFFDQVTGDRKLSIRFLPIVGTFFLFIACSNWFGLFPGTGAIGRWFLHEGKPEFVPLLRSANSDLNLTIALALVSVLGSHLIGMMTLGFLTHWNKFIQIGGIVKAIKSLNPINVLVALVEFIVGLIELFSEAAKVVSLSLRLFGNIFAGEVLLTVITGLVSYVVPVPFMLMEILVGIVQATVFSLLTLVYLTQAVALPHGEEDHDEHEPAPTHGYV